ncbi:helix-turn-helix domain-containing protein [Paenibacillus piri]|uniref:AraC family transcriptional regulator n=1 Tax=Paenibacillus piri TaxID=2547395 RepID=A0A4R5KCA6_9BACL|nr:AraC family transcriptional regulator [Paenibacillus piri]TDF92502.1 AraC family transcriptional regulator [Paenibacillus piri]
MLTLHSCYQHTFSDNWHMEHSLSQYNVLVFITYGSIDYWVNDETVRLEGGDVLLIPAGSIRGGASVTSEGHQRYATHFSCSGGMEALLPILGKPAYAKTRILREDYFKQRFSLLCHHWMMKSSFQAALCFSILLEMLGIMNHDLTHEEIPSKKMRLVEAIKSYIVDHYRQPIKLVDISEHIMRTPTYITNIFKEVTGLTPIEYLHHVRIDKSKELMFSTSMSIGEIADYTGFCDQAYFNRVFKKMTGYPPSSFLSDKRLE